MDKLSTDYHKRQMRMERIKTRTDKIRKSRKAKNKVSKESRRKNRSK